MGFKKGLQSDEFTLRRALGYTRSFLRHVKVGGRFLSPEQKKDIEATAEKSEEEAMTLIAEAESRGVISAETAQELKGRFLRPQ